MKKNWFPFIATAMLLLTADTARAQGDWNYIGEEDVVSRDTVSRKGFTLIFINKEAGFDEKLKARMIKTFFKVYPKQAKEYNKATAKKVVFVIDPGYKGVAATGGTIVRYNPEWFHNHPGDIDVVTHEVMHIVQSYPGGAGPGWITEGIADYVRYTMGVDNKGGGWELPAFNDSQHYENAYRVTARFFVWLEKNGHKGLVRKIDNAMRSKTYSPKLWKELTGKTLDELWKNYAGNPVI